MAHLTNFSFEYFCKIFTEDASQPLLYHGAKKSKMTKNSNQGGSCLKKHMTLPAFELVEASTLDADTFTHAQCSGQFYSILFLSGSFQDFQWL